MLKLALFVRIEAKNGKEAAVEQFLKTGLELATKERGTPLWFALKLGPSTYGVFDAFNDEKGRQGHLNGPIAAALMEQTPVLFSAPPTIEPIELIGTKLELN